MMTIAQIRNEASRVILERNPELVGLVQFDANVTHVCRGMYMVNLLVMSDDYAALREIAAKVEPHPYGVKRSWPLGKILDHYCNNEPANGYDFELAGLRWLIGDGDDSMAVTELGADGVSIWVRAWDE